MELWIQGRTVRSSEILLICVYTTLLEIIMRSHEIVETCSVERSKTVWKDKVCWVFGEDVKLGLMSVAWKKALSQFQVVNNHCTSRRAKQPIAKSRKSALYTVAKERIAYPRKEEVWRFGALVKVLH